MIKLGQRRRVMRSGERDNEGRERGRERERK